MEQPRWKRRNTRTFNLGLMGPDVPPGAEEIPNHNLWIDSHIWRDPRFHALGVEGSMTVFHLLTTGQAKPWETPYAATLEDLAEEFGEDLVMLERGFEQAIAQGFVIYDAEGGIVLLPPLLAFISATNPEGEEGEG
jgi:hypothetical protein